MNDADPPDLGRERAAGWPSPGATGWRTAGVALFAFALACCGEMSLPAPPWTALALPAGLALSAGWRWGRAAHAAALLATGAALLVLGMDWDLVAAATAVLAAGTLAGHASLFRLRFDMRLERAGDVGALVVAAGIATALPSALALTAWLVATRNADPLPTLATGWCLLALGMISAATVAMAFDRAVINGLWRGSPRLAVLLAAAALAAMLWLLGWPTSTPTPLAELALFVPPLVVTLLALRGQLALAALWLLAAASATAIVAAPGVAALGHAGLATLAGWYAASLTLMLTAHATTVEWRSRAQRWEWALDGSRLGVADWHLEADDSFASAAWRALTGHAGRGWSLRSWRSKVHPEDRAALDAAIESLSSGAAGRSQVELRLPRRPDGWRWAEATLMVIERNGAGRPLRLLATLADVDDRHHAQEHQRLSASLFQHLHEGLLIADADMRAVDVNPAYTQILGVPRDEVIGTVPSLLRPAPADPVARQQRAAMWAGLRDTGSWRGELLEHRRNGEACTLKTTISAVHAFGPDGVPGVSHHVVVVSDVTEQQAQREQLERQAHYDELTRLPNRVRLSQLLVDAMAAADRDGYLLAVCYLDLDRFKPVNDSYGHAAGDRLLVELAGRLRSALRSRDQWADSAARLGGDEFVLLLRAGTLEEARMAVERVLRVVALPYVVDPSLDPVHVTASMGATVYPVDRSDADALLRHADHAMYSAKQAGRNGYLFFDPEHRRRTEQRVMAIGRIQEALDQQEFLLHYQPKVDMRSGRVVGFEALLRWEHPQQGLIAPLQFLPLIENTGLSARIGDWVLSQALDHLAHWRRDGLEFSVSVNVSARHLQERDFAQRLAELLARHSEQRLAPLLELEMLETAAHADIDATSALVARCRAIGVRFALDDFGTGYSTLSYLKQLPVDVLKIDRSFVHHMLDDAQDRAIVEGVVGLARTFGCTVVAEGVESPAQARTLLDLGCDIGQGTGIAAPMPAAQVAGWVRDYRGMFALAPAETPSAASIPVHPASRHGSGSAGPSADGPLGGSQR